MFGFLTRTDNNDRDGKSDLKEDRQMTLLIAKLESLRNPENNMRDELLKLTLTVIRDTKNLDNVLGEYMRMEVEYADFKKKAEQLKTNPLAGRPYDYNKSVDSCLKHSAEEFERVLKGLRTKAEQSMEQLERSREALEQRLGAGSLQPLLPEDALKRCNPVLSVASDALKS